MTSLISVGKSLNEAPTIGGTKVGMMRVMRVVIVDMMISGTYCLLGSGRAAPGQVSRSRIRLDGVLMIGCGLGFLIFEAFHSIVRSFFCLSGPEVTLDNVPISQAPSVICKAELWSDWLLRALLSRGVFAFSADGD